ncbi:helix-turn-helix and ligand-binding sensor domain-containing protein [Autumnicola musiva]|uniref:LuxR C-terminal-related transcriptional regulator n=1 Tax=Autumnicola musiva TaxID=3075589 RepID=A0ABU3D926_9FLAO|nr:LuxR C-terminal-related transcriptional regulator [Zunongwangia sp. F117]MDT0678030.1 LuxR C-terminal-related transcriptional regulator [Zunongwangia sp. F117]
MKVVVVYILIFNILGCLEVPGQELNPPIQNYSSVEYNAASQNWDVGIDEEGILYSANHQGLLSFDGQRWELFPLETGATIRSVYPFQGKIYTGSYREFGYWERDVTGKMKYTSLMSGLKDKPVQSEEFWEILSYKDAIYFRSFAAVYKYKDSSITRVKDVITNKITVYRNKLLVAISKRGLFFLEDDGELTALGNQSVLKGKTILDILVQGDSLLIGTRDAMYRFDGEEYALHPDQELNNIISDYEFNHIMKASNNEVIIGTVKNGIIQYNLQTRKYNIYNRSRGLQNNTILGMAGKNGHIWLGLDNGIDKINLDSSLHFFTDDTGELGAVYDLAFYRNSIYLASNTGVYTFNSDNNLILIGGSQGHTWNLEVRDDRLFANHNTGLFEVQNDSFSPLEVRTGSYQIAPLPEESEYLVGTYTGISMFSPSNGEIEQLEGVDFPVQKIIYEDENTIWAVHPYDGAYRIKLSVNLQKEMSVEKLQNMKGLRNSKVDVFRVNNQIAMLGKNKWYRYNIFRDSLEIFKELEDYTGHKLLFNENDDFWFINLGDNSIIFTDFQSTKVSVASAELNHRLVKGNERIVKANDSIYYITLNDGFATVNLKKLLRERNTEYVAKPILLGLADTEGDYPLNAIPSISYKKAREITVQAALPESIGSMLMYQLEGSMEMQGEVKNGVVKFQNLPHGDYKLQLFGINPQGEDSEVMKYAFIINPPWYLSKLMKLVYVFIFMGIIGLIYWFNRLKLNRHQWLLEQKFEEEHKERINEMEKERLLNEIDLKRKELANSTMMAVKKNEVLMDIQAELDKDREKFSNQFRLKHIMNKINKAIKNKDEWKVFETNFNELHEDFFKDILEKYPKLTNKDLKLCSYLKMNLTSKEIAPLMGISVRGVEVHRYRLRKKMNLDKNENLTNFLIKNF